MNYFELHIGDYAQATAHLSLIEDAIYWRLIRKYYADEKPLPAEISACQRIVGARSKEEKFSVEIILKEFFVLEDDGWHQKRCDEVIEKYQSKQRKARESAQIRWKKEKSEGNADGMRSHTEGNANHKPITNNQEEEHSGNLTNEREHPPPENAALPEEKIPIPAVIPPTRAGSLATRLRSLGINTSSVCEAVRSWCEKGIPDSIIDEAIAIAKQRKDGERFSSKYLDPIVQELLKPKPKKPAASNWRTSEAATLAKGADLGLSPNLGEGWDSFRRRIDEKIESQKRAKNGALSLVSASPG